MNRLLARAVGLALLAGAALAARPVAAYVRYVTSTVPPVPFYWPQSCVTITAYPNDLVDMTPDQILVAVSGAAGAWSAEQNPCSFLRLQIASSTDPTPTSRYDNRNSIIFRAATWCKPTDPPGACTYDPAALAITSVFVNTKDGKIRDADVEVNARYFTWTDLDLDPSAKGKQDLQNALTHELGHLIGLDHTCYLPGSGLPRPVDNLGQPVPDCANAPEAVKETTMFASAVPGDTSKRTLAPDDQAAVCSIYPVASDPMVCPVGGNLGDGGGCSCGLPGGPAGRPGAGALLLAALALCGAGARRRRDGAGRRRR